VGIGLLAAGLHGYFLRWMPWWERGVAIVAAILLVVPALWADMAGLAILAALIAFQLGTKYPEPTPVRMSATKPSSEGHA
jgi:TRAP-type uncharacterized transport system fused permease subunit